MDYLLIAAVAYGASLLTLYSGFGLGTLLLPVFALFFPVPVAVAATGVVHLLNNLFKGALLWRRADWSIIWRLGAPAVPAAIAGAWLLGLLGDTPRLFIWGMTGREFGPTAAGLVVGLLMIVFALLELHSGFRRLSAPPNLMPFGGAAIGFLGGLTGQQGALRSIFLLKSGLTASQFIATGVMIAILVDLSRLPAYAMALPQAAALSAREVGLVAAGTLAALAGAWVGTRCMEKVTIGLVRNLVAALMAAIGLALVAGVLG